MLVSLTLYIILFLFTIRVGDEALIAVSQCSSLQFLNVSGCHQIGDAGLIAIARGCPELTYLDVSVLQVCSLFFSLCSSSSCTCTSHMRTQQLYYALSCILFLASRILAFVLLLSGLKCPMFCSLSFLVGGGEVLLNLLVSESLEASLVR